MITNENYIKQSLELHLFFARIMKEHSFFLEAGFTGKDEEFKRMAKQFQVDFGDVMYKALDLSNGNISREVMTSEELVTKNTLKAEKTTNHLAGSTLDENITMKELELVKGSQGSGNTSESEINQLNEQVLPLLDHIIRYKGEVLKLATECKIFTLNYPLLLEHMLREAKMYKETLEKLQRKEEVSLFEQEKFWNRQMMEHAQFIRGLLDPTEEQLMTTADKFSKEYKHIINSNNNQTSLTAASLQETMLFKQFKESGTDGLLSCKIKSIIVPILADHILREANHFIRVMKKDDKDKRYYYYYDFRSFI